MMHACSVNDKQCFKSSRKPTEHHMQMPLILRVVLENKMWTKKCFQIRPHVDTASDWFYTDAHTVSSSLIG